MSISLIIVSIIAGLLTVLAPCVLPLLPVILGTGASHKNPKRVLWVVLGLSLSIFIFTLILRTAIRFSILSFLDEQALSLFSALIIGVFGISLLFPGLWALISLKSGFENVTQKALNKSPSGFSPHNSMILGASLGPVFTSCSPTYFVIIGLLTTQESLLNGIIYLVCYIIGLAVALTLIGTLGQLAIGKIRIFADPRGIFKRVIGLIFIALAVLIGTGLIKDIETELLELSFFQSIIEFEEVLIPSDV